MRWPGVGLLAVAVVALLVFGAASGSALDGTTSQAWPWVQLLAVFAAVYVTMGVLAFGPLLEEP